MQERRTMRMTPRERMMAVFDGEEPDKIPVYAYYNKQIAKTSPGGWHRRLSKRGLGTVGIAGFCTPVSEGTNPNLPEIGYSQTHYTEDGLKKFRHTFETPVGQITGVLAANPLDTVVYIPHREEALVKEPSDWRVVNFIYKCVLDKLRPNYNGILSIKKELGDSGIVAAKIEMTPWQRAWVEWASLERTVVDFLEQPEELQEYVEIQNRLHTRIAEFAADCPCRFINVFDNMTDVISPKYYRSYCLPIYEMYSKQLEGTDKVLGVHMDGNLASLKDEIAETPCRMIESFTVPPAGNVSLSEARNDWPGKLISMNCPPHLHWAEPKEVRKGYESLVEEWGSKRGLILNRSESVPVKTIEAHLSAAMDALGYD